MYKVMIVDDEPLFRDYLCSKMDWDRHGFRVCCEARNGQEALEEADRHQPHLALVDINMPFMGGIELAEKLKARFTAMAIVFVTGHNEFEYVQQAVRIGVHDYLLKPFNRDEVADMLKRIKPSLPVLLADTPEQAAGEPSSSAAGAYELTDIRERLQYFLHAKDEEETLKEVRNGIRLLRQFPIRNEYAYTMLMGLLSIAISYAGERGIEAARLQDNTQTDSLGARLDGIESWSEAEAWMVSVFRKLLHLTQDVRSTKSFNLFTAARTYIEQHYTDPELSVEQVAGGVFVDPSYLRRVFRKESGFSVLDHITNVRMKKAKEMMLQGNRKLSEIAAEVGYSDPNYFSKSFKKRFGMTPTEYEQLRKPNTER